MKSSPPPPTRSDIECLIRAAESQLKNASKMQRDLIGHEFSPRGTAQKLGEAAFAQAERALALAKSLLVTHGFEVKK